MFPIAALMLAAWLASPGPAVAQDVVELYAAEQGQDDPKGSGVRFTRPDGTPIYVNPHAVAFVRSSLPGEHGKSTIVFASGAKQAVMETVDEVIHGISIDRPRGDK